ncbi:MAG: TonB-dependent receptor plug domain-containing protein [Marinilabiliales bacterium]|nr:TonB-dependent receptor plug domain-containing protein [Marinilabiliales bacterium]
MVGYGTVKKRDLTGSVSSVRSDEIVKTASSNALQSIQGKVAGLDVTRESGETGSEVNMTLRGVRSVNASNSPLFLVDGIEYGSTLDINPSDIASIEVLKDASSTAIYGTRGANGVIIITTKRGDAAAGGKSTVSFNTCVSLNSPTNLPRLMDVEQDYLLHGRTPPLFGRECGRHMGRDQPRRLPSGSGSVRRALITLGKDGARPVL